MSNRHINAFEKSKETEHYKEMTKFRDHVLEEAEAIVLDKFPKKVVELNALLNSPKLSFDRISELMPKLDDVLPVPQAATLHSAPEKSSTSSSEDVKLPQAKRAKNSSNNSVSLVAVASTPATNTSLSSGASPTFGTPVYGFPNGVVPCNAKLMQLINEIRPLLRDAVEDVNKVKIWILFLIPRIEDGNNFGVSIQEECLNEVRNVESEAASFLDQMSRYFHYRGRLITKIAKYPHVEDYRYSILDTDEKQFLNIRLVITEMRNHFATLHDMLTKNLDKIKKPRNNNMENMY